MLAAMGRELRLVEHRPGLESPEGLAEKDRPIFQAALACRAGFPLTGDLRDFGRFMNRPETTFGVRVMTVEDFLRTLVEWRGHATGTPPGGDPPIRHPRSNATPGRD